MSHCRIHNGSVPPFLSIGSGETEGGRSKFKICQLYMGSVPPHFLSIGSNIWEAESGRDNLNIVKFTWGECRLIFFPLAAAESKLRGPDNVNTV